MVKVLFRLALWVVLTAALVLSAVGVTIAPSRPVSFLIDARSEIVSFEVPETGGYLPVDLATGAICLLRTGASPAGETPSPCPRDLLVEDVAFGDLGLPPGSDVTVSRMGTGPLQVIVTPSAASLSTDCRESGAVVFQPATPRNGGAQSWCETVLYILGDASSATTPWIAIDDAQSFLLGHYLNAGAASGSPTVLDGTITMRGQSLFRDMFQQLRGEQAALSDVRWIVDFGEEPIVKTEQISFCCSDDEVIAPPTVLRVRAGEEGLDVVARTLATGARAGAAGGATRVIAPSTFDRLRDPATAWIGGLIALLSLFPIVLIRRA